MSEKDTVTCNDNTALISRQLYQSFTPEEIRTVTMVATSTLKAKSSDCISELVERRYDQVFIEKGGYTGVFCVFWLVYKRFWMFPAVRLFITVVHGCSSGGGRGQMST